MVTSEFIVSEERARRRSENARKSKRSKKRNVGRQAASAVGGSSVQGDVPVNRRRRAKQKQKQKLSFEGVQGQAYRSAVERIVCGGVAG